MKYDSTKCRHCGRPTGLPDLGLPTACPKCADAILKRQGRQIAARKRARKRREKVSA